jgi:DNA (cytosine-5)-methyltransferase 1
VTKWHGFRQIGNSVPPLLAKAVASEIMSLLYVSPAKPQIVQELGDISWLIYSMSKACKHYSVNPHIIEPRSRNSSKNKHEKL